MPEMQMMATIVKATEKDFKIIAALGRVTVEEAHRLSCSAADMQDYLMKNYNDVAIREELNNPKNI